MERKHTGNIKNEYGYILRWINDSGDESGTIHKGAIWLENVNNEDDKIYITKFSEGILNQEAYDYIKKITFNAFKDKSSIDAYDNYIKLFNIMGLSKKMSFSDLLKERNLNASQLSKLSKIPYMTISDLTNAKSDFKSIKVETALKIADALELTIESIYNKLYK